LENEEVEHHWLKVKDVFVKTTEEVLGFTNPTKKDWLSEETWKEIEERKKIKEKMVSCRTRGMKIDLQAEYNNMNHEVKRNIKEFYQCTRILSRKKVLRSHTVKTKRGYS
jgi:hypothetical protein